MIYIKRELDIRRDRERKIKSTENTSTLKTEITEERSLKRETGSRIKNTNRKKTWKSIFFNQESDERTREQRKTRLVSTRGGPIIQYKRGRESQQVQQRSARRRTKRIARVSWLQTLFQTTRNRSTSVHLRRSFFTVHEVPLSDAVSGLLGEHLAT